MAVRLIIAVTDRGWFDHLRMRHDLPEINFWSPGTASFRALEPGELFLFKLHAPYNVIVGGGVFTYANTMPCSLAWQAFGPANGTASLVEMRERIIRYRRTSEGGPVDFTIGCRILTQPFFFEEKDWLSVPASWSSNIVQFKTYSTDEQEGLNLWNSVQERVARMALADDQLASRDRYGTPSLIRPRLGQASFRILVTDAFARRCAVTGERTLPALEAAHIRPYADGGGHDPGNGLLLRRDIHALFDAGYVTVTPELNFEVSGRIKQEFENGRHYYALHGQPVQQPVEPDWRPNADALRWHNEERYLS